VRHTLVLLTILLTLVGCQGGGGDACASTECDLARIDGVASPSSGDATVASFQAILDRLEMKCSDGRDALGDMAVDVQERLDEAGTTDSLANILEDIERSIPTRAEELDCTPIFDSYAP